MENISPESISRAEQAREKIKKYISLEFLHKVAGTYENEDDPTEGKNV